MADVALGPKSKVFRFGELTATTGPTGVIGRRVLRGTVETGEAVEIHESMQPGGVTPMPQHVIAHTELLCVREGTLEFLHDGKVERAEAGSVLFVAKGTMHQMRNGGDGPVSYFVVEIGGDV